MVGVLDPFGDPEKSMVFKDLFLSLDHECLQLSIGSAPLYHFRTLSINIYSKFAHCMNNNHKLLSPPGRVYTLSIRVEVSLVTLSSKQSQENRLKFVQWKSSYS